MAADVYVVPLSQATLGPTGNSAASQQDDDDSSCWARNTDTAANPPGTLHRIGQQDAPVRQHADRGRTTGDLPTVCGRLFQLRDMEVDSLRDEGPVLRAVPTKEAPAHWGDDPLPARDADLRKQDVAGLGPERSLDPQMTARPRAFDRAPDHRDLGARCQRPSEAQRPEDKNEKQRLPGAAPEHVGGIGRCPRRAERGIPWRGSPVGGKLAQLPANPLSCA